MHLLNDFPIGNLLNESEYRPFWIRWTSGHIQVGRGLTPRNDSTTFMEWIDPDPLNITSIELHTRYTGKYVIHGIKSE